METREITIEAIQDKLKRHAELKEMLERRDAKVRALKDEIDKTKEAFAEDEAELAEIRSWLLRHHIRGEDEYVEAEYDGFTVEVKWLAKYVYDQKDKVLIDWLRDNRPEALKVEASRSAVNKIIEGLSLAGMSLPPNTKRKTEATLYVTEDKGL